LILKIKLKDEFCVLLEYLIKKQSQKRPSIFNQTNFS